MDLKNILDPKTRYIFFTEGDLTHAYPIIHVKANQLFFTAKEPLPEKIDGGHFLAQGEAGIVQFDAPTCLLITTNPKENMELYLYVIDFSSLDYSLTNRRASMRYEFKEFIPISFQVYGELMTAQLINISEGGLRLRLSTPLNKNVVCRFSIKLPLENEDFHFETDGIVVYSDTEQQQQNNYITGISFVVPEATSGEDKEKHIASKEAIRRFVFEKEKNL
ncbi:MAG: PilZ domain-containing protein [bacterium]|nr:PilZ domain-containing protein [bacterium]MBU1917026.1 PilZ domain-containing protein [bacterium]